MLCSEGNRQSHIAVGVEQIQYSRFASEKGRFRVTEVPLIFLQPAKVLDTRALAQ